MNTEFSIDFITVDDYLYLAAEISFRGQRLCQIYRTESDAIEIAFLDDKRVLASPVELKFLLSDFLETVESVRRELLALKM
jgi:hypothetical protein